MSGVHGDSQAAEGARCSGGGGVRAAEGAGSPCAGEAALLSDGAKGTAAQEL